jgi:hypothetical protein
LTGAGASQKQMILFTVFHLPFIILSVSNFTNPNILKNQSTSPSSSQLVSFRGENICKLIKLIIYWIMSTGCAGISDDIMMLHTLTTPKTLPKEDED